MNYRDIIKSKIEDSLGELKEIRDYLYNNPETMGEEDKSSQKLISSLKKHGFIVEKEISGIPYSFKGIYDSKKEGATLGLMAEYDALPDIGHGCGHDLICTISLLAAYGIQSVVDEVGGKIIVFGTPGEEGLCSKRQLSLDGVFDDLDAAMMIHPNPTTYSSGGTMALESLMIEFYGKSAHAGSGPQNGINALDAAVNCYQTIANNKQYYLGANVYGIFKDGGQKVSIIPDHASLHYYVRVKSASQLSQVRNMIENVAEGSAKGLGCKYKIWNNEVTSLNMMTNRTLSDCFNKNLLELGYDIKHGDMNGSTDMGDVSYRVPSIHPWVGMDCEGYTLHSKEFADLTISEKGDRLLRDGAISLAYTALELYENKELVKKIKEEFEIMKQSI